MIVQKLQASSNIVRATEDLIITDLRSIFTLRVKTFSGIRQIIAALPLYWLVRGCSPSTTVLLNLTHTMRVLRFPDASRIWSNLEQITTSRVSKCRSIFQIVKIFGLLILTAHYVACAFYSIASVNKTDFDDCEGMCMWNGTWIEKQIAERHIETDGGNVFVWYSRALYWAVATMVVVVIGDVTPVTVQYPSTSFIISDTKTSGQSS